MLCGVAPFSHIDSTFDLVAAILNDEVPHIQDRAPWLEPGLALAVHRALAREPNDRPATLEDFADALRPYSSGDEILKPELIVSIPSQRRQQALQRADLSAGLEPAELPKGTEADDLGLLGRKLSGQYRVLRMIGKGGMGAVYEVSTENGELRAAKVVALGKHGANPSTLQRFAREAKAASAIDSPHVVATHDAGTDDDLGFPYIIMELLNGVDLSSVLKKEGALDPEVAVRIVLQGARGVAAAHGRGVVHRDIKPANLFLQIDPSSGGVTVKVCDFGVAKRTRTDLWGGASHFNLTRSGGMLGSPMYMSPEQAKNAKAVDERTDVWSLAVVLWEALSGQRLWGGQTSLGELIVAICTEPVSRLEAVAPWVPLELARFVHSGLQRDPAQRPQSVPDFMSQLESFSGGSHDVKKTDLVGLSEEQRGELARRISLSEPPEARAAAVRDALAREAASLPPPEKRNSDRMQTKLLGPPKKSTAPRKSKPAAKGGTLGLVAVAALSGTLAAGLAYFAMRSAITQDSDSTAALVGAANAPPVSGSLAVEPRDARVFVDGKPAVVSNGSLTLTGKPGSRFTVSVEHGGKKKSTDVQLGGNGKPEPGRVGLN
jgi:serine/threonine protein kinase